MRISDEQLVWIWMSYHFWSKQGYEKLFNLSPVLCPRFAVLGDVQVNRCPYTEYHGEKTCRENGGCAASLGLWHPNMILSAI